MLSRRLIRLVVHLCGVLLLVLANETAAAQSAAQPESRPEVPREGQLTADDGAKLYYRIIGAGSPVVIVPGALFLEKDFARLARGRTLVVYDMRNRGRSERIDDSTRISIEQDVRDLEAVRQYVGVEKFVPIGWSYLGMMVMRYAAAHPDRVWRIVQIGPLGRAYGTQYPDSLTARDASSIPDSSSLAELVRLQGEGLPTSDPKAYCERDHLVTRVRLVGTPRLAERIPSPCAMPNEWPTNLQRHFRLLFTSIATTAPPSWERFSRLAFPVLTIHGTQDRNAPYGAGKEWAAHLSQGRLLTVRGAAHMPWLDAPRAVFPAIEQFLRGAWPRAAVRVKS